MLKKSLSKSTLMTALITGSVIWGGYTVGHAEEQQAFFLDEMVVTATRTPVEAFKANANISVITKKEIEERDYQDMHRAISPLKKADDAIELDTSNMTLEEVVDQVLTLINKTREE